VKLSLRLPPPKKIWGVLRSGVALLRAGKHFPVRREILVIAALAGASVVLTLIVMAVSFNARETRAAVQPHQAQKQVSSSVTENALAPEDFDLPPLPRSDQPPDYYFFRPRLSKWSKESVDKFWVPPRQIATDTIEVINDKNMESMFEKVR
jgi:hypothetical protein